MHAFNDYMGPLTVWIYAHPESALLITLLISFAESLAIIGSIIPGSVVMTAVGIIAGSGFMRIDFTYLAATIGAVLGDSASYLLGYRYSEQLIGIWPFNRYPHLVSYGKDYFAKHGGKSVLLGRFFGPLRSIIPVVAGMMHMHHGFFFLANLTSAVLWAVLYITPGVLIGVASTELSHESATRLFAFILISLLLVWVISITLRWLVIYLRSGLHQSMHFIWTRLHRQPYFKAGTEFITPEDETDHFYTASLLFILITSVALFMTLTIRLHWAEFSLDSPVFFFLESLKTPKVNYFFILITFFLGPFSLLTVDLVVAFTLFLTHNERALKYWGSLNLVCLVSILLFSNQGEVSVVQAPPTQPLLKHLYPAIGLTYGTALFGFLIAYLSRFTLDIPKRMLKIFLIIILLITGPAYIYLGEYSLSSVLGGYLLGMSICLFHWILYRRIPSSSMFRPNVQQTVVSICIALTFGFALTCFFDFQKKLSQQKITPTRYVFSELAWWDKNYTLLPTFRMSRTGRPISTFNLQYVGELKDLEQSLSHAGWKEEPDSFFKMLLLRVGTSAHQQSLPLFTQLYLNKKPLLTMSYKPKQGSMEVLRVWASNYFITGRTEPIWVGSVHPYRPSLFLHKREVYSMVPYQHIIPGLANFHYRMTTSASGSWLLIHEKLALPFINDKWVSLIEEK